MKIYTKGGDEGTTSLRTGARVPKNHPRVSAYAGLDETNTAIGAVVATCDDEEITAILRQIQAELFVLGAELATPDGEKVDRPIDESHAARLERWIDEACAEVPPLTGFVLPGGSVTGAGLHVARATCRRAERAIVNLAQHETVGKWALIYVNRLSDLLFALARRANHRAGIGDSPWVDPDA
jgi:cob(I)alamin adenosyltransferase